MGTGFDVADPVLFQLGLKTAGAAPGSILAAIVGEHLLGRLELAHGHAIDLDDRFGGGTAKQIGPDQVAGVVVQVGD